MRGEELPEERMLSVSKSWFSRSVSSGAINECPSEGIPDTSLSKEGGLEDRDVWGSFSTLRQLSMRRSRPSEEIEREVGSRSPSMTPRNVTPLTPLTPLKWKSNACEQEEEEKALEPSIPGSDARTDVLADERAREKGEEAQTVDLSNGLIMHDRTKSIDENFMKAQVESEQNTGNDSPDERKPSSGEDVMTMTIEFLRARLLSERSASKAAKQRALQLGKKVMELEQKLEQAVEDRKKAETDAKDSILKLTAAGTAIEVPDKTAGEANDKATSGPTEESLITSRATSNRVGQEKELQQDQQDLSRAVPIGTLNEMKDSDQAFPTGSSKMEEPLVDKGRLDVLSTPQKCVVLPKSTKGQESRAAIEDRLRNMWNQISEEMTALAGERSQEDLVREELMSWMEQVPTVLQDIIPKNSLTPDQSMPVGAKKLISHSSNGGLADDSVAVPLEEVRKEADSGRQFRDVKTGPPSEGLHSKGQLEAESKRVAVMLEEYEAQESVQRDWEIKYYESQRKLEQFKGDHHDDVDRFAARHQPSRRESLPLDYKRAPRGSPEAFSRFPHRIAKSKSSNDFIRRMSNEHPPDINAPNYDALYTDFDTGSGDRFRQPARGGGHPDPMYNTNGTGHRRRSLDMAYVNQSPMQQEHAVIPSRLTEAGHQGWSDRQFEPEPLDAYNNQASRDGGYLSYSEGGPLSRIEPFRPFQAPTNRSTEAPYRSSQPDYRRRQWDGRGIPEGWGLQEAGEERGGHYAQSGYSTANERSEKDNYRQREGEGFGRSSQPDGTDRHQDRRSVSDNADWSPVEDFGLPNRSQEPGPTLETQQSYIGHPLRTSTDRPPNGYHNFGGSNEDMQYQERHDMRHDMNEGAYERRRDSQASLISGHQYAPHPDPSGGRVDRSGSTKTEPLLSLGYGPAYDAPKEDSPVHQLSTEGATKNVSDVLRALMIAKSNIQNGNSREQSFRGVQAPLTTQPPTTYTKAPQLEGPVHPQAPYRYTKPHEHAAVRAPGTRSLYSSPNGVTHEKTNGQDNRNAIHPPQVSPNGAANGHDSYIDKLNVGNGIQFFFS